MKIVTFVLAAGVTPLGWTIGGLLETGLPYGRAFRLADGGARRPLSWLFDLLSFSFESHSLYGEGVRFRLRILQ